MAVDLVVRGGGVQAARREQIRPDAAAAPAKARRCENRLLIEGDVGKKNNKNRITVRPWHSGLKKMSPVEWDRAEKNIIVIPGTSLYSSNHPPFGATSSNDRSNFISLFAVSCLPFALGI